MHRSGEPPIPFHLELPYQVSSKGFVTTRMADNFLSTIARLFGRKSWDAN